MPRKACAEWCAVALRERGALLACLVVMHARAEVPLRAQLQRRLRRLLDTKLRDGRQSALDTLEPEVFDELLSVHAALHRLEAGSYGLCVACHQAIDVARLDREPWIATCRDCRAE